MHRLRIAAVGLAACAAASSPQAQAQDEPATGRLDPVVVSAQRTRESAFDAPASISAVTRETIDCGGPQVNFSEALRGVPGISILNRQNYARDLRQRRRRHRPGLQRGRLRAGFAQRLGPWRLSELVRVDNATDRGYAGSVMVNDANQRYFEAALPRNWMIAVAARYEWE